MKKLLLSVVVLFVAQMGLAADGQSKGCFDLAIGVSPKLGEFGVEGDIHLIKTRGMICTVEKNIKYTDEDQIGGTGEITVRVFDNGKVVSKYDLGAISQDGALGTFYTSYARTQADLNVDMNDSSENYKIITFAMRNDHIKKGEYAGRVILFGNEIILLQR